MTDTHEETAEDSIPMSSSSSSSRTSTPTKTTTTMTTTMTTVTQYSAQQPAATLTTPLQPKLTLWDRFVLEPLSSMHLWGRWFRRNIYGFHATCCWLEWIVAWLVVIVFAVKYCCVDFLWHALAMQNLRHFPHRWCRVVPLTTLSQTKTHRLSPRSALTKLMELLPQLEQAQNNQDTDTDMEDQKQEEPTKESFSDAFLLNTMANHVEARRLASQAMIPHFDPQLGNNDKQELSIAQGILVRQLQRLWPQFLVFPQQEQQQKESEKTKEPYDISVIVPIYRENPISLLITLTTAWKHCTAVLQRNKQAQQRQQQQQQQQEKQYRIQVVVVNAGGDPTMYSSEAEYEEDLQTTLTGHFCLSNPTDATNAKKDDAKKDSDSTAITTTTTPKVSKWSDFQIVSYRHGGGRGGCLNYGAQFAQGRIVTFLHSDVMLPMYWDEAICQALDWEAPSNQNNNRRPNLCAFSMGIDDSELALTKEGGNGRFPPGLSGAAWQGRIRSTICRFPFGDSVLSVRKHAFDFIGGFPPHQPLLEDVALVQLFRQRAGLFIGGKNSNSTNDDAVSTTTTTAAAEPIIILPQQIACSPRRWQQYNVPYVALANWTFLEKYQRGTSTEELYQLYYNNSNNNSNSNNNNTAHRLMVTTEKKAQ